MTVLRVDLHKQVHVFPKYVNDLHKVETEPVLHFWNTYNNMMVSWKELNIWVKCKIY